MTLSVMAKNLAKTVQHRSPVILTGLAIGGLVSTVFLTAKATPKAKDILDRVQKQEGRRPKNLQAIKLVWVCYIPPAVVGSLTIACIITAQSINTRRQSALAGAFAITENAFQEYRDHVVESFGKAKDRKIRDELVQKQVSENPPSSELVVIGSGNVLCLDTYTGRYFESTMEKIRSSQNDFNQDLLQGEMYLSVNEFYQYLGLPPTVVGEQVGFSPENLLDIDFSTAMTDDGRPCLAISFRALPRQDYYKLQ